MIKNEISESSNNQIYGLLGAGLLVFVILSILAGIPAEVNLLAFVSGLVVLFLALLLLFGLTWYLLFKPLPEGLKASPTKPLAMRERFIVGIIFVITGNFGLMGGIWDVAWHASFGIPFGEDFFWRPHQYIYLALFTPILVAAYIALQTLKNCKGTLQQRFRADMPLSLVMTGGIFMACLLPADPIWHALYREDLTGLSVPHTLFTVANLVLGIGFLSIFQSYTPARSKWESVLKFQPLELPVLLFNNIALITFSMATIADWEVLKHTAESLPNLPALVQARPDWALPALATFLAVWVSHMTNYASKRYGMATLTLILATITRQGFFYIFGYHAYHDLAFWYLIAPMVITVDVLHWLAAKREKAFPIWQTAGLLTIVASLLSLPQINFTFAMPQVTWINLSLMIPAIFIAAGVAAWIGMTIGGYISNVKREEQMIQEAPFLKSLTQAVIVIIAVIFVLSIWFIGSSSLPIA